MNSAGSKHIRPFKPDRRRVLQGGALAAGGLVLGIPLTLFEQSAQAQPGRTPDPIVPQAFIHIDPDDTVTLIVHKPEVGQGTETSIAMLLAEELDCDWNQIKTVFAPVNAAWYGGPLQGSVGSRAIRSSFEPMRQTGAAARQMLVQAAAAHWGIGSGRCRTANGVVTDVETGNTLSYGSLADAAAQLPVPEQIVLKDPSAFRLLGMPMKRRDTAAKINGSATFGIDIHFPGMLYAVVARSPVPGGTLASFDASAALALPGVRAVFEIPQGLAVVAEDTWAAISGRRVLRMQWDEGANATLDSTAITKHLLQLIEQPGVVAHSQGDADEAARRSASTVDAVYQVPYLAHAPLEPLNAVVLLQPDSLEIWAGSQLPGIAHSTAVATSGLATEQVQFHTLYSGGGFGGRGGGAHIAEAIEVAKHVQGTPVKLQWTREDDLMHDRYRPASSVRLRAGLDSKGQPVSWTGCVACSSFAGLRDGIDREAIAGLADVNYALPHVHFEYHEPGLPILTNYWRSVGHSQNTFFAESFIDELAAATGSDPVDYRRNLLRDDPRLLGVLELAAEQAGWGKPLPAGHVQGVAVVHCFGSYNAQIAEVSLNQGQLQVHRVVSAVDCGQVVNPAGVVQQMQSAIVYGLTAALHGQITFANGRVQQTNFHQYPPLRMKEMPVVDVHIVPSTAAPGGIGETGTPAIAPAVTNAIFSATGKRVRQLPIDIATLQLS